MCYTYYSYFLFNNLPLSFYTGIIFLLNVANPTANTPYFIDQYWKRLQPQGRWYVCQPRLAKQRRGVSDIELYVTDYNVRR